MAGAIAKITRNFQVTLPKYVRELLDLHEGELVSFEMTKNGKLTLTPLEVRDKEQAYYWAPKWQKSVAQSMEEYKKGEGKVYKSVEEARKDFSDK